MITTVDDPRELRRLVQYRDAVTEPGQVYLVRRSWAERHGWVAVPWEGGGGARFDQQNAGWLTRACQRFGWYHCYAVSIRDDANLRVLELPITAESLVALSDPNMMWMDFVLLSPEPGFAVLCDEMFKTYAGPRMFVEMAIDDTLEVAREEFDQYFVIEPDWSYEEERALYRRVSEYYRGFVER